MKCRCGNPATMHISRFGGGNKTLNFCKDCWKRAVKKMKEKKK